VLDSIARAVLGDAENPAVVLGDVTLHAHQLDALRRVQASIGRVGGALLADEPGLGKTFVALALAVDSPATIVVAPAALRAMWREAARRAGVLVAFVSMETLSRREFEHHEGDGLVIVDEAHHVSNPTARRYARLARLTAYKRVLLLSATPVRNRQRELAALLALFMGPRAYTLDETARAQCIVRRAGDASLRPEVDGPRWHRVRSIPRVGQMIANLPPALPALDGREASALVCMTLARCWASSLAALDSALRHRLQRGAALGAILDDGRVPTRAELCSWVVGDDAVQLAFPMFAAHQTLDAARMRRVLSAHLGAVRALRETVRPRVASDARERSRLLLDLRARHQGARIVAFTSHAATAEALYRALARENGVALLTSRGARTAGGSRPRSEVIEALGMSSARHVRDVISLAITTDLLSEGVNLQGASVIVHLDVPWTPAGLDQRVGRAARMGSSHARVCVHGIAPPAAAERFLTLERRLARKRSEQANATRVAGAIEQLHDFVRPWLTESMRDEMLLEGTILGPRNSVQVPVQRNVQIVEGPSRGYSLACIRASMSGFLAVVAAAQSVVALGGVRLANGRWRISPSPGALLDLARSMSPRGAEPDPKLEAVARAAIKRWLDNREAREAVGSVGAPSRARRSLLGQIDAQSRRAATHTRAANANRIARVRALVDQAISAGAERILDELASVLHPDLEQLLSECESRLSGTAIAAQNSRGEVRALLLLQSPV
jgi:superfamily II DNA or RNA helicase